MSNKKENEISYVFDLDNILKFVFDNDNDRTNESEITETYATDEETDKLMLINKQLREVKGNSDNSKHTIRYDMIKMFIEILNNVEVMTSKQASLGERIVFNTMINNNLIKDTNLSE
jgi:hypothetical protein